MAKSANNIKFSIKTAGLRSLTTGHCPLATVLCLLLALPALSFATKLDLSSNIDVKASNYTGLITGSRRQGQALYSENASLGFIIKDIKLEKAKDSSMDVGVVLNSIGNGASTDTLAAPQFTEAAARYPNVNGTPFIKAAYIKVYRFLNPGTTLTLGRQAFTLGQGITLADDGLGLPGARIEAEKFWRDLNVEAFFFRPFKDTDYVKIIGAGIDYPASDGYWSVSHFWEQDDRAMTEPGHTAQSISRTKKFTNIRYFMNHRQLRFDGEFILQRGNSKDAGGKTIDYGGYAFLIKGLWNQNLGAFLGPSKMHLAYGKSSGNPGPVTGKDKAFTPAFGHRFSGVERDGFGRIAGASLYDIIKTSDTANGLPDGVSGLNIINMGLELSYRQLAFFVDFFKFRAAQNMSGGSIQVGNEWDLKAAYKLGERLGLNAVYAVFRPSVGLYHNTSPITLVSLGFTAKF